MLSTFSYYFSDNNVASVHPLISLINSNNDNNNNNTTSNYSINSTAINLNNTNDSSCILLLLVTNSLAINALNSRANIFQFAADACNLPSSFHFKKS